MNKKMKLRRIYLAVPFGIAITTCLIVNYALDQKFTWSALVATSCIFGYLILFTIFFGGKHRFLLTYAAICIFIIPYLYVVERIANLYMPEPIHWAGSFGAPLSIAWLAAFGLIAVIRKLTRANWWMIAGFSVLAFYVAERFTNLKVDELVGGNSASWRLSDHYPIIYFGVAAILLFIGVASAVARFIGRSRDV